MKNTPKYNDYREFLKQNQIVSNLKESHYYLKQNNFISSLINLLPCAIYILNYQTGKYLFVSQSSKDVLGYTANEFIENSNAFYTSRIHPIDLEIVTGTVFQEFLAYTKTLSANELKESRFSHNYRFKRKDEKYIHLLQQYVVLESNKNYPLLILGLITDISAHKHDNNVVLSVSRNLKSKGFVLTNAHSHPQITLNISKREHEVIKHIMLGKSSKQIAEKLHVSLHTINAHRRNILQKTNSNNTAELISYAMLNGLG
jgi:DNA-binding CsgD family transcriptional regulator